DETEEPAQAPLGPEDLGEEIGPFEPYEPLQTHDTGQVFMISPEDENLLWGTPPEEEEEEPKTISAEDYWDPLKMNMLPAEQRPKKPETADDAYAAAFLAGAELPPDTDRLKPRKRRVTGKLNQETEKKPFEDIRSVLMDDYQAVEQQRQGRSVEAGTAEEQNSSVASPAASKAAYAPGFLEPDEDLYVSKPRNLKEWLATRTILQKIILVEMILVVLGLVTAVPFFFYLLMRGPQSPAIAPNELAANLPYPAGLTLPGGWHFQLGRSTMVNNQWKPVQSEWLEGTELRRVVALPWNRQTEAVVLSFKPGDEIAVDLSNADTIKYSVERVEQISIEDTSIYSDLTPSLVIILYADENTDQARWVVFCKR
ncbi:MAG: hypothetical protein IH586_21880, partial [Anaerolineaceae bacterium]|nr:hypothetical protein [Anaerolineaceae bacterium]